MKDNSIYSDIAKRTGGDIYIGVVGPVRTGKSTFIHRFLDSVVIPNIENEYDRERTLDQMPQSASGKTVMTTEPKFVPDEAVRVSYGEGAEFNVKMVDCVGYMVEGALGGSEDGEVRMVMTPWSEEAMPFADAAELGTSKVIGEHATIAMLVTTDGSIADIPRESYIPAEERVVRELREHGKPFAIILNSANPVLGEFPLTEMRFSLPEWTEVLPSEHPIKASILDSIIAFSDRVERLGDIERESADYDFERVGIDAGEGMAEFNIPVDNSEYYRVLSEMTGLDITGEKTLMATVKELAEIRDKYEKVADALADVEEKGYGIVMPSLADLKLEEPKLVKQANGYGVKVTAHADSIHMIKTGIKADLCHVVGSEEQSEEVVKFLAGEFEDNPEKVWEYNMFGKSLYDMVSDGMNAKLSHMPDESREKLGETLGKIINEGSNGLICILL